MTILSLFRFFNNFRGSKIWLYILVKFLLSSFIFLFLFEKAVQYKDIIENSIHLKLLENYYNIFIIIWLSVIWFIIYALLDWFFIKLSFLWLSRSYRFIPTHWPKKFIFEGGININKNRLIINQSSDGCLIKSRIWKNFKISFNFIFKKDKKPIFGFLFRAQNFENYFMLQFKNDKGKFILFPHIRVYGSWNKYQYNNQNLSFDIKKEHQLEIIVINEYIEIKLDGNFFASFYLPTHHHTRGNKEKKDDRIPPDESSVNKIYFRVSAGKMGFRCYSSEWVEINNLEIEPIRWWNK